MNQYKGRGGNFLQTSQDMKVIKKAKLANKFSDELVDGDNLDDQQLENENEDFDENLLMIETDEIPILSNQELLETYMQQAASDYGYETNEHFFAHNHILPGSHITEPREKKFIQLGKYSDELANGDSADDKDIHEDEDMNDDVVDVHGHTNAGYGSYVPSTFFEHNHIMPGSHITEPREPQFVHLY